MLAPNACRDALGAARSAGTYSGCGAARPAVAATGSQCEHRGELAAQHRRGGAGELDVHVEPRDPGEREAQASEELTEGAATADEASGAGAVIHQQRGDGEHERPRTGSANSAIAALAQVRASASPARVGAEADHQRPDRVDQRAGEDHYDLHEHHRQQPGARRRRSTITPMNAKPDSIAAAEHEREQVLDACGDGRHAENELRQLVGERDAAADHRSRRR